MAHYKLFPTGIHRCLGYFYAFNCQLAKSIDKYRLTLIFPTAIGELAQSDILAPLIHSIHHLPCLLPHPIAFAAVQHVAILILPSDCQHLLPLLYVDHGVLHPCHLHVGLQLLEFLLLHFDQEGVDTAGLVVYVLATREQEVCAEGDIAEVLGGHAPAVFWDLYGLSFTCFILAVIDLNFEPILLELEGLDFVALVCDLLALLLGDGHYLVEVLGSADVVLLVLQGLNGVEGR